MKVMVFTEGTVTMHKSAVGHSREQIVQQVINGDPSVKDYGSYVPIGNAVETLTQWKNRGAEILYLTSRQNPNEIQDVESVLHRYGFPNGQLLFRRNSEGYKSVVEQIMPDVLIEDDCESIGGIKEMTITHVDPTLKAKILSLAVPEFGGIDHLGHRISTTIKNEVVMKIG